VYYGKVPIVYGSSTAFQQLLDSRFKQYSVWLASYRKGEPKKTVRLGPGGTAWTIWQHNESGRVAGINDFVDQNVYLLTQPHPDSLAIFGRYEFHASVFECATDRR
jgi:lysozyme